MTIAIPYVKQTWSDGNPSYPTSAARMGVLEEGILDISQAPAVRAYNSGAISVNHATPTALSFDSERFDQAAGAASTMHDTVTNNSRLTALYAGIYLITGTIEWVANATGERSVFIRLNGSTDIAGQRGINNGAGGTVMQNPTTIYSLAVNNYVELIAYQTSGAPLNVGLSANRSPEFAMTRIA